ncbi:MAG: lysophospholipid acyltransferase family protein [Betaproteobacteria bacterium]
MPSTIGLKCRLRWAEIRMLLWGCLAALGLGTLLWTPVAAVLHLVLPEHAGRRVGRAAAHAFFRFYVRTLRATGYVCIELHEIAPLARETPLIVAANHPSLLDALLLLAVLPDGYCLMKPALTRSLFWGAAARLAGYVGGEDFISVTRTAVERLRQGGQLIIFPEGTRSDPWPLGPLHGGVALIARQARVPIQAVVIESNTRFLSKGWPLGRMPPLPLHFRLRCGARIDPQTPAAQIVERLRAQWTQTLPDAPPSREPQ